MVAYIGLCSARIPYNSQLPRAGKIVVGHFTSFRRIRHLPPSNSHLVAVTFSIALRLLSPTIHSQDTHSPYAIPHSVASSLDSTRYVCFVQTTARIAWLGFCWEGQLRSDSIVVTDTSNTLHYSHFDYILSQCLASRRLPISRPGRPLPSTMTSECFYSRILASAARTNNGYRLGRAIVLKEEFAKGQSGSYLRKVSRGRSFLTS